MLLLKTHAYQGKGGGKGIAGKKEKEMEPEKRKTQMN